MFRVFRHIHIVLPYSVQMGRIPDDCFNVEASSTSALKLEHILILTFSILVVHGTIIQLSPLSLTLHHCACNTATAQITETAATS